MTQQGEDTGTGALLTRAWNWNGEDPSVITLPASHSEVTGLAWHAQHRDGDNGEQTDDSGQAPLQPGVAPVQL